MTITNTLTPTPKNTTTPTVTNTTTQTPTLSPTVTLTQTPTETTPGSVTGSTVLSPNGTALNQGTVVSGRGGSSTADGVLADSSDSTYVVTLNATTQVKIQFDSGSGGGVPAGATIDSVDVFLRFSGNGNFGAANQTNQIRLFNGGTLLSTNVYTTQPSNTTIFERTSVFNPSISSSDIPNIEVNYYQQQPRGGTASQVRYIKTYITVYYTT